MNLDHFKLITSHSSKWCDFTIRGSNKKRNKILYIDYIGEKINY